VSANRSLRGRAGWVGLLVVLSANTVFAATEVLFPAPLHITRELTNPITGSKTVIDDYCYGNRVVSVNGRRTAIAEYDRNVITAIDFNAGTYSVTKFEELAKAWEGNPSRSPRGAVSSNTQLRAESQWRVEPKGSRVIASRPGESIEAQFDDGNSKEVIQMTVDTQLRLSRAAAEVLLGVAYPNRPDSAAEVLMGALRDKQPRVASNGEAAPAEYHIPLEHVVRQEFGGETVEARNVVLRVGNELPPPDILAVPPGSKLVESDAVAARRILEELDGVRPAQR
jgi:hypothetical protein